MIQEVVGTRVGRYFLPAFAGVAFSSNEFRWSPRIRREDGLIRLVPGLGTRAVDRLTRRLPGADRPGQPGLRVNVTPDEIVRYSPQQARRASTWRRNAFETIAVQRPAARVRRASTRVSQQIVSMLRAGRSAQSRSGCSSTSSNDELVVTFDGLITRHAVRARRSKAMLELLRERWGRRWTSSSRPTARDLYLLQCRPQSSRRRRAARADPAATCPAEQVLFSANRYVSNGRVPDITHVVYVDPRPLRRARPSADELLAVGRAVGRLNKLLPKRQFILMGPGRWGSRGDIKLGRAASPTPTSTTPPC